VDRGLLPLRCAATRKDFRSSRAFLDDPARYWSERDISPEKVRLARTNLLKAAVPIPAYIDEALADG
jgi:hypothetical protein